ncbi:MAG: hypothetical protein LUH05_03455 [Candidatus Gastranaerophilales bacterium]|nr:hypothetical protein [Candidatus Gastranaerophilales bacterium]
MQISNNYNYNKYGFYFGNSYKNVQKNSNTEKIHTVETAQKALNVGLKISRLPVSAINNLEFAKDLDMEILPAETMQNRGSAVACIDYVCEFNKEGVNFVSPKIYVPQIISKDKTCKAAYADNFTHEYQHYLFLQKQDNEYRNLYNNLKNEGIFSPDIYRSFVYTSDGIRKYLGGDLMRQGIYNIFGNEGKISCEKNYGLIRTPKEITEDNVAKSIGFKNAMNMIEEFKKFKAFDVIAEVRIIHENPTLLRRFKDNPEKTKEIVNKIQKQFLKDTFYNEYNSYSAEYELSEKLCCPDYGAKYAACYDKLLIRALS